MMTIHLDRRHRGLRHCRGGDGGAGLHLVRAWARWPRCWRLELGAALWLQIVGLPGRSPFAALVATRPLAHKMLDKTIVPTNADRVLHHTGQGHRDHRQRKHHRRRVHRRQDMDRPQRGRQRDRPEGYHGHASSAWRASSSSSERKKAEETVICKLSHPF